MVSILSKIIYEQVDSKELSALVTTCVKDNNLQRYQFPSKFEFVNIDILNSSHSKYNSYCKQNKPLAPFEKQAVFKESNDYNVNVVARIGEKLIGLSIMLWFYDSLGDSNLWNYRSKLLSVKTDYENMGVATNILKTLEQVPEIQGKVLRFGNFSDDGKHYLRKKIPKIFTNKSYYLFPKDDSYYTNPFPKEYGCYLEGDYD